MATNEALEDGWIEVHYMLSKPKIKVFILERNFENINHLHLAMTENGEFVVINEHPKYSAFVSLSNYDISNGYISWDIQNYLDNGIVEFPK